jgi:hypothetical protein
MIAPMRTAAIAVAVLGLAFGAAATGARLPGVKTPSRNISCFYVPVRPTARGNLLCDIKQASYLRRVQDVCQARAGLDWHGFALPSNGKATVVCAGGIMYDPRDTPTFVVLAYGRTWRYREFTCSSRVTGLTCTTAGGHGLFLSRDSYRLW